MIDGFPNSDAWSAFQVVRRAYEAGFFDDSIREYMDEVASVDTVGGIYLAQTRWRERVEALARGLLPDEQRALAVYALRRIFGGWNGSLDATNASTLLRSKEGSR